MKDYIGGRSEDSVGRVWGVGCKLEVLKRTGLRIGRKGRGNWIRTKAGDKTGSYNKWPKEHIIIQGNKYYNYVGRLDLNLNLFRLEIFLYSIYLFFKRYVGNMGDWQITININDNTSWPSVYIQKQTAHIIILNNNK